MRHLLLLSLAACSAENLGDSAAADDVGTDSAESTLDSGSATDSAADSGTSDSGETGEEAYLPRDVALCDGVNAYRVANDLPAIPLSPTLMAVARHHVEDAPSYFASNPGSQCNLHSWSDNTPTWGGCCYTSDHAEAQCMWDKPSEISGGAFTGNGYENSAWGYSSNDAAIEGWKQSSGHNAVMLNEGGWANFPWRGIGCAGEPGGYFYVWFSDTAED